MSSETRQGFYFFLASTQETSYLYAEVYYSGFLVCTLDTEKGDFSLQFCNDPRINYGQEDISVSLHEFTAILDRAKKELQKFPSGLR
jgi:hypothetical protein